MKYCRLRDNCLYVYYTGSDQTPVTVIAVKVSMTWYKSIPHHPVQFAVLGVKRLVLSVCLSVCDTKKISENDFPKVYTSSKHIKKLKISRRRTSAYLGVANAVHCIHNSSAICLE